MNNNTNEIKRINQLKKQLRGFKERFKNPTMNFEQVSKLYLDVLFDAFDEEDINLDYLALKSYNEVQTVLDNLNIRDIKLEKKVLRFQIILDAVMSHHLKISNKKWD